MLIDKKSIIELGFGKRMNNMKKLFLLLIYDLHVHCGSKQNIDFALTEPLYYTK